MKKKLGVVIVTYNSSDVVLDCLESLWAAPDVRLKVVVIDNGSSDSTCHEIREWGYRSMACERVEAFLPSIKEPSGPRDTTHIHNEKHEFALLETGLNSGYAGGVNRGIEYLLPDPEVEAFWILNPDCAVLPYTPMAFADEAEKCVGFGLMGGRVLYFNASGKIQTDGGLLNRYTGATRNVNQNKVHELTPPPKMEDVDFISGSSMVVSRSFYETVGPMPEQHFLYYEEVEWALHEQAGRLRYCEGAIVLHRAGTAIGSPRPDNFASPLSIFFKHRNRMRIMRKYFRSRLVLAYIYSFLKAMQFAIKGHPREAALLIVAALDLPPPTEIAKRLSPEAQKLAFGRQISS